MDSGQTMKCKFCGKLYVFYSYYAGDQSACPSCVAEARKNVGKSEGDWKKNPYKTDIICCVV